MGLPRRACATTNSSYVLNRLPTLRFAGEHPEWDGYLAHVYNGTVPSSAYPINLATFSWFYFAHLPISVQPAQVTFDCALDAHGHAWTGPAAYGPGLRASHGHRSTGYAESSPTLRRLGFFVEHSRADGTSTAHVDDANGIGNHTWVEVMRAVLGTTLETRGSWYFYARGEYFRIRTHALLLPADRSNLNVCRFRRLVEYRPNPGRSLVGRLDHRIL